MSNKTRLDVLLVEQGLLESRQKAQAVIMAGSVFVDGQRVDKPGTAVPNTAAIQVRGHALPYVSRGGLKLEKAMQTFPLTLDGKVCADIGADLAVQGQGKRLHGLLQLQAAPADIGQSMAPHLDGGGIGHRRAGLVHPLTVNKHTAGHDNGLGLLAAFQQALLHQQHIQSRLIAHAASPPRCGLRSGRPDRRLCITGPPYPGGQTGRPDFSASDSGAPSAPGPG